MKQPQMNFQASSYLSYTMLCGNDYILDNIPQNNFQLADVTLDYCLETGRHAIKWTLNSCTKQLS